MSDSVGRLFRPIVIDVEIKDAVNRILRASADDCPEVYAARRSIAEKAPPKTAYLYAAEVRAYLEEKTRVGTEDRVFPIAGDLFLDSLEANLASVGPNFFKDHYHGIVGCFRHGNEPAKALEAPLYCVELALQRAIQIGIERVAEDSNRPSVKLAFFREEAPDPKTRMNLILDIAESALADAVDYVLVAPRGRLSANLVDLAATYRDRLSRVLQYARKLDPPAPEAEQAYLDAWLEEATEAGHPPVVAIVREELGKLCLRRFLQSQDPEEWNAYIHRQYEAGDLSVRHGNREREIEAWNLSMRRHNRAAELFEAIQDRTSAAKALVEKARSFISAKREGEVIRDSLHKAVCLVVAHRDDLPQGKLPRLNHDQVCHFLASKGYTIEAAAYRASLDAQSG